MEMITEPAGEEAGFMLSRARRLDNLILIGFTEQVENLLKRGPPQRLIKITEELESKADATFEKWQHWPIYDSMKFAEAPQ